MKNLLYTTLLIFALIPTVMTQETTRYMEPPKELLEIIDAPTTPSLLVNPTKTHALLASPQEMPDIADLAQPELRLAGIRINPRNFGDSKPRFWNSLSLQKLDTNKSYPILGLPEDGRIRLIRWSPNGERLAIVVYRKTTIELWVADAERGDAKKWASDLNSVIMGFPIEWAPDSKTIYFASRILSREGIDFKDALPVGPSVQVSSGKKTTIRTYQDMLQNPIDEDMFEHYATSTLAKVSENGKPKVIGNPGLYSNFSVSPNGEYLLVQQIMRPFSYIVPYYSFPLWVEVWSNEGILLKKLAEIPLAESIPQGFSAVQEGPRSYQWRADKPATIVWAEAQDGGDPKKVAEIRDMLYMLDAPFNSKPTAFLSLNYRYAGITWGWDNLAVVYERWWETRSIVTSFFNPSNPRESKKIIWDRSWQDAYGNPGNFLTELNHLGYPVLKSNQDNSVLYLSGQGASPQGNMPFLDELNLNSLKTKRLWQCQAPYFEQFITTLDNPIRRILTQRESETEQPNFFIRDLKKGKPKAFTSFPHPYPQLANVQKELVRYKRSDGIELTATLYLPAEYKKGSKRLPVLMWAYPQEYVDANLAAQVTESPYRFIRPSHLSPVMWVARGYAVLDRVGMPIVAKDSLLPNDTFVDQLTENAQAAINFLVEQKIGDSNRIAIGGHSYGAFMTANLLAHTNLFAAGIARSGAYNRTLTPFGFQGEERTYWEAPKVYDTMSPFMHADKLKKPLLLIHGVDDNNSGTFPMQSERLYQAINGHGGTARLVMLPFESHGYRARQSILHQAWEIDRWLEDYLGE